MQARIKNPAQLVPGAMPAVLALHAAVEKAGVAATTLALVHLRASQINGCAACVTGGARQAKRAGESDDRLYAVATWRDAPYFNDAERAALALAESVTRISDSADPVPDVIWQEAKAHYDEPALAALVLWIATTNLFNRVNVSTRQPAGVWG
ncbi:MAG: carboxymuconolactone decarboxylase family protein [Polyangiales bacterium]